MKLSRFVFKNLFFLIVLLVFFNLKSTAQITIGVNIGGIGYHTKKVKGTENYKWKLNKKGNWAGFASVSVLVSYRINNYIGIKTINTFIFQDCAGRYSGISHIGIDLHDDIIGWKNPTHQFSMTVGPFWYYRKNWTKEAWYKNDPNFLRLHNNNKWESLFIWHGGQIQYQYFINDQESVGINFLPAYPYLYTFGVSRYSVFNVEF